MASTRTQVEQLTKRRCQCLGPSVNTRGLPEVGVESTRAADENRHLGRERVNRLARSSSRISAGNFSPARR
jgi:hypothetical protein